jgi:hypothetical protein
MPFESGKYFVTPRDLGDNRMRLEVSESDYGKLVRGRIWAAEMTEIPTGRRYKLYPAACGQPNCFCDAIAVEMVPDLTNVAPVSGVIPMEEVLANDEDKVAIGQAAEQAIVYWNSFTWSKAVLDSYFGGGVAGVFAVFLLHIVPAQKGIGDWMWVAVGDVPPIYLPLEDAESVEMVFKTYVVGITRWIEFARQGKEGSAKDGVPPIGIKATPESAELMYTRLKSLVQIIGPLFSPQ